MGSQPRGASPGARCWVPGILWALGLGEPLWVLGAGRTIGPQPRGALRVPGAGGTVGPQPRGAYLGAGCTVGAQPRGAPGCWGYCGPSAQGSLPGCQVYCGPSAQGSPPGAGCRGALGSLAPLPDGHQLRQNTSASTVSQFHFQRTQIARKLFLK